MSFAICRCPVHDISSTVNIDDDPEGLRYGKNVILATDAEVDGTHMLVVPVK